MRRPMIQEGHPIEIFFGYTAIRRVTDELLLECPLGRGQETQLDLDAGNERLGQTFLLLCRKPVHRLAGTHLVQCDIKRNADDRLLPLLRGLFRNAMCSNQLYDLMKTIRCQIEQPFSILSGNGSSLHVGIISHGPLIACKVT